MDTVIITSTPGRCRSGEVVGHATYCLANDSRNVVTTHSTVLPGRLRAAAQSVGRSFEDALYAACGVDQSLAIISPSLLLRLSVSLSLCVCVCVGQVDRCSLTVHGASHSTDRPAARGARRTAAISFNHDISPPRRAAPRYQHNTHGRAANIQNRNADLD